MKILLTGATGFLGSHIAEEALNQGHEIFALKRHSSNLWRCNDFNSKISWLNCDNIDEISTSIIEINPQILIHSAWNGVGALDRDNWIEQEKNLTFLVKLLEAVKQTSIKKIIALGSQAEYGNFEGAVDENYPCKPISAYGAIKVCSSKLLQAFAEINKIDWYWIRIFSVFGPKEENNWLIPSTIKNLLENTEMNLTPCEQKYDYLYAKDFATGILAIANSRKSGSGIYNFSSGKSNKLKDILLFLEKELAPNKGILKIGSLPYRPNQVMHMQGISDSFYKQFEFKLKFDIYEGLVETTNYILNQRKNEN